MIRPSIISPSQRNATPAGSAIPSIFCRPSACSVSATSPEPKTPKANAWRLAGLASHHSKQRTLSRTPSECPLTCRAEGLKPSQERPDPIDAKGPSSILSRKRHELKNSRGALGKMELTSEHKRACRRQQCCHAESGLTGALFLKLAVLTLPLAPITLRGPVGLRSSRLRVVCHSLICWATYHAPPVPRTPAKSHCTSRTSPRTLGFHGTSDRRDLGTLAGLADPALH